MHADQVARYLTAQLDADVRVTSLFQTFPGQSQETWLVDTEVDGEPRGFVVRRNPPGGGIVPFPLRREWEVYVRLARTQIPVGEPLWYDEGGDWFGDPRPFFVRALVPGSTVVPGVADPDPAFDGLRQRVAEEHATRLAELHTLDWAAHGFGELLGAPASPADAARHELETWSAIWDDVRNGPFPMVTEALAWFEQHLPKDAPRLSLLKGNNGLGEEIWLDERIVALSDWELASIGDPAQDWAFSQGMLAVWDRERTLAHYEAATGFALPRENLAFWQVWTVFKAICCTRAGLRGFTDGRDRRAVLPAIGFGSVKLAEGFLAVLVDLELEQAAALLAGLEAGRLQDPAAGGKGR